ncbi:hypothetical protein ADL19_14785 [Streptomyces purpurogeneiscleroticus]|nr:hypothetical protein ADL19_14785 [Streptomyces purpurogeneiscleroticus]
MAIALKQHTDESGGFLEAKTTTLGNAAKIAYVLFTGIVKDKIGYVVRELTKNAWEVSPEDKPFQVDLPTRWSPRLRIRDFGPGLSHHFMMHRYASLGDSTKDTNGIGGVSGWGLGSKSPLAYLMEDDLSGSYAAISYRDGMASHYIISLDSGGMPQVKHFMDVATTEPNGLEVSFAVRMEDFRGFEEAARRILWSFQPRPKVSPDLRFGESKVSAKGGNWTMFDQHTVPFSGPQVRVGPVMYPIDMGEIDGSIGFLRPSDCIIFDMDPDAVSPTASREQLQYTGSTKRALSAMVQEYEKTFLDGVQAKVDAATCYFGGCEAFRKETYPLGLDRARDLREKVTWGGQTIRTQVDGKVMHLGKGWSSFDRFRGDAHINPADLAKAKVVVEHNPYLSLDRFLALNLSGEDILWARLKRDELPDFLKMCALDEKDVIVLDKAPLTKKPGTNHGATKTNQIRRRRAMTVKPSPTPQYEVIDMHEGVQTVDLSVVGVKMKKVGMYYSRRRDSFDIGAGYKTLSETQMRNLLGKAHKLGLLPNPLQILIDTGVDDLDPGWEDFGDWLDAKLREKFDPADVTPLTSTKKLSDVPYECRMLMDEIKGALIKLPEDVRKLRAAYGALAVKLGREEDDTKVETISDKIFDALNIFRTDMTRPLAATGPDPVDEVIASYNAMMKKYPLISVVRGGSRYDTRQANMHTLFGLLSNQKG